MAGFGAGALLAGLSIPILGRMMSQERLIIAACVACTCCSLCMAFNPLLPLDVLALAVGGAGWVLAWSWFAVNVQLASPRWVVGRCLAIYYA
jgi:hypothetical protein